MGGTQQQRQKRLQRKRQKRAAQRAGRRSSTLPFDPEEDSFAPSSFAAEIDTHLGIQICCALLAGAPPVETLGSAELSESMARVGGIWKRLPFELSEFMHRDAPWSLTCAQLSALRRAFETHGAGEAFERLWTLALTLEPNPRAALAAAGPARRQSCAHRATLAFGSLRECLEDPAREHKSAIDAVAQEIQRHHGRGGIKRAYKKLLLAAVKSVHARRATTRARDLAELLGEIQTVFEQHASANSHTAWWACGCVFFEEVLQHHARAGLGAVIAGQPAALGAVMGDARAALWIVRAGGSAEALAHIPFRSSTSMEACLTFFSTLKVRELRFEDRLRYEISRLKVLRARARSLQGDPSTVREFLSAFSHLQQFLAHGVPPQQRDLPQLLRPALLDFYIETIEPLDAEGTAFETTRSLLEQDRRDFRLACLYATGALALGQRDALAWLETEAANAHVSPELFARHAFVWVRDAAGAKTAARLRAWLIDPLDREQRKHCLLKLAQEALRRADSRHDYEQELRSLLPYFDRTNFISRELREGATLEPELVFFASMMAPVHGARLALNESQSQQWVSAAREIARRSTVGAEIAVHYLRNPSPWIGLAAAVRDEACDRLEEFRPPAAGALVRTTL